MHEISDSDILHTTFYKTQYSISDYISPPTFPSMQRRPDRKFRLERTYKAASQAAESERCVAGVNLPRPRWDEPGDMTARAGI